MIKSDHASVRVGLLGLVFVMLFLIAIAAQEVRGEIAETSWYTGDNLSDTGNAGNNLGSVSGVSSDSGQSKVGAYSIHNTGGSGAYAETSGASVGFSTGNHNQSVCLWVYPQMSIEGAGFIFAQTFGSVSGSYHAWWFMKNGAQLQVRTNSDGAPSANVAIPQNIWSHLCAVYNTTGQTVTMYQDGVVVSYGALGTTPDSQSPKVVLFNSGDHNAGWNGYEDDVRIYFNLTLTPENVSYLYNAGSGTPYPLGFLPCVTNWTCAEYGDCVASFQNCTLIQDLNVCGSEYVGNFSEFPPVGCTMPEGNTTTNSTTTTPGSVKVDISTNVYVMLLWASVIIGGLILSMRYPPVWAIFGFILWGFAAYLKYVVFADAAGYGIVSGWVIGGVYAFIGTVAIGWGLWKLIGGDWGV